MFPHLPEELERNIWSCYFERHVLNDIKKTEPIWHNPSQNLLDSCQDIGCIQHLYTDLERTLYYNSTKWCNIAFRDVVRRECFDNLCDNCLVHGFPCTNARYHGGLHPSLDCFWNMDHYKIE